MMRPPQPVSLFPLYPFFLLVDVLPAHYTLQLSHVSCCCLSRLVSSRLVSSLLFSSLFFFLSPLSSLRPPFTIHSFSFWLARSHQHPTVVRELLSATRQRLKHASYKVRHCPQITWPFPPEMLDVIGALKQQRLAQSVAVIIAHCRTTMLSHTHSAALHPRLYCRLPNRTVHHGVHKQLRDRQLVRFEPWVVPTRVEDCV